MYCNVRIDLFFYILSLFHNFGSPLSHHALIFGVHICSPMPNSPMPNSMISNNPKRNSPMRNDPIPISLVRNGPMSIISTLRQLKYVYVKITVFQITLVKIILYLFNILKHHSIFNIQIIKFHQVIVFVKRLW